MAHYSNIFLVNRRKMYTDLFEHKHGASAKWLKKSVVCTICDNVATDFIQTVDIFLHCHTRSGMIG